MRDSREYCAASKRRATERESFVAKPCGRPRDLRGNLVHRAERAAKRKRFVRPPPAKPRSLARRRADNAGLFGRTEGAARTRAQGTALGKRVPATAKP